MLVMLFSCFGDVFCISMCFFSLKKVSNLSDIAFLSIAVKTIVSLSTFAEIARAANSVDFGRAAEVERAGRSQYF